MLRRNNRRSHVWRKQFRLRLSAPDEGPATPAMRSGGVRPWR